MLNNFSYLALIFLSGVAIYTWNENRLWRKEFKEIDQTSSIEIKQIKLLRLLVSITCAIFICLTFILAFLALMFYKIA